MAQHCCVPPALAVLTPSPDPKALLTVGSLPDPVSAPQTGSVLIGQWPPQAYSTWLDGTPAHLPPRTLPLTSPTPTFGVSHLGGALSPRRHLQHRPGSMWQDQGNSLGSQYEGWEPGERLKARQTLASPQVFAAQLWVPTPACSTEQGRTCSELTSVCHAVPASARVGTASPLDHGEHSPPAGLVWTQCLCVNSLWGQIVYQAWPAPTNTGHNFLQGLGQGPSPKPWTL